MDAATCRQQLARLIADETRFLNELAGLLEREHGALQAEDAVSLEGTSRERQRCVAAIVRSDEERRALCRTNGRAEDLSGLEDLMRWCDSQGSLAPGWAQCSAAAAHCRTLNDRNGALVGARLKHVRDRLGVLIQGHREGVTYGRRGADAPPTAGRLIADKA